MCDSSDLVQHALRAAVTSGQLLDVLAVNFFNAAFDVEVQVAKPGRLEMRRGAYREVERLALEDGLRRVVVTLCTAAATAQQPLMQYDGQDSSDPSGKPETRPPAALEVLLDLVLWLGDYQCVDAQGGVLKLLDTPAGHLWCYLLEDVMDLGTIDDCRAVFQYTSNRARRMRHVVRQGILRLCNQLVKRLSKACDVSLCGAILMFIARLHPMSDKSGVNLSAATNTALPLPVDQVEPGAVDSSGELIDEKLYTTFWGLQPIFQDPSRVLLPGAWSKASADIATLIHHFERCAVTVGAMGVVQQGGATGQSTDLSSLETRAVGDDDQQAAVSYLSSSKLFGLQLRDATFRRIFLVQCLILCQAVQQPGKGEKERSTPNTVRPPADVVASLVTKLYEELGRTPDYGGEFSVAVRHLLEREEVWVGWKVASCPAFDERPPALGNADLATALAASASSGGAESIVPPAKRRRPAPAQRAARPLPGNVPYPKPAPPRGLVVQPEDNMAGLTEPDRHKPKLREYLEPFIQDIINVEPGDADGEREKLKHTNKVYDWRAKRLLSRNVLETYASCKEDIEIAITHYYPDVKGIVDKRNAAEKSAAAPAEEKPVPGTEGGEPGPATAS